MNTWALYLSVSDRYLILVDAVPGWVKGQTLICHRSGTLE